MKGTNIRKEGIWELKRFIFIRGKTPQFYVFIH